MSQAADSEKSRLPKVLLLGLGAIVLAGVVRLAMPLLRPAPRAPQLGTTSPVAKAPAINQGAASAGAVASPPNQQLDYASAKIQIESTIAQSPKAYDLRMQAAQFYMRANDHPAAIPHLRAAARMKPKELMPWLALGDAGTLGGKADVAEAAYQRALQIQPDHPLVARGRGQLLVSQKRFPEARKVLETALAKHPKDLEIRRSLGNLMLIMNKPRLAIKVMKPAVALAPESAELHYILGEAHERDRHINEALKEMQAAVQVDPNMAEAWGRMGLYLINLARYTEAREPAERAIALEPNVSQYHWVLGDSYLLDTSDPKNFQIAEGHYKQSLKLDPTNTRTLYSLAMGYSRYGTEAQVKESIPLLEKLIALAPHDMNAYYKLAEAYRRIGEPKKAEQAMAKFKVYFEKGRRQTKGLFQSVSFVDTAQAHLSRAREHMEEKRFDLAIKSYELALDRDPKLQPAREELARARKLSTQTHPTPTNGQQP